MILIGLNWVDLGAISLNWVKCVECVEFGVIALNLVEWGWIEMVELAKRVEIAEKVK